MHTLAKIILSAIGIFFAIRLLSQLPYAIFVFYSKPSWQIAGYLFFSLLVTAGAMGLLVYFLIYQHDKLAKKIVGSEQLPEPDSQIQWLPVALRLICIAGGIYLLSVVLWHTTYVLGQLAYFKTQENAHSRIIPLFNFQSLLPWIVTLICGVYLLSGAPHFVRWHVKKILQQCKDQTEIT